MLVEIKPARPRVEVSELMAIQATLDAMVCKVASPVALFQLPLTQATGVLTGPESSPTVLPILTTLSCLSVKLVAPGRSRTLGDKDGENLDTLDWQVETLAVSAHMLVSLPIDDQIKNYQYKYLSR